jgi:hypothetical protein
MATKHAFEMHQNLLAQVIKSQAGSLWKAVLELVMNSIDAGAKLVDIELSEKRVTVSDDGTGMDKKEIETCFKIFGLPQTDQDKQFGKFRMGRGQAFAFGKNTWRTGPWKLFVDVEQNLGFELDKGTDRYKGCQVQIDLYRPVGHWELNQVRSEVQNAVRYMDVKVLIDGQQVNLNCKKEKWSHEDDYAYYKFEHAAGALRVYNRGAFVQAMPPSAYGLGGVVVSKQKLDVNFARNDVIRTCPIWQEIVQVLREQKKDLIDLRRLNEAQRHALIADLLSDDKHWDRADHSPLFPDVTGKYWSAQAIDNADYRQLTICKPGNVIGDKLQQHKQAFVLSERVLELFRVGKIQQFFHRLPEGHVLRRLPFVAFQKLSKMFSEAHVLLTDKELKLRERITLEILRNQQQYLLCNCGSYRAAREKHTRLLHGGYSETSRAWTDGQTYIAFNRQELCDYRHGTAWGRAGFWTRLGLLLLHEYCHDDSSVGTHVHSDDFYQSFHDLSQDRSVGPFVEACLTELAKRLTQLTKAEQKAATRALKSPQTINALAEKAA